MDRFFAARTVLSFYPLRAASLLPQDTKLATATAFSLLPSGITVVIQVLPATIRFSVTLESETAERLGPLDDAIARGLAQAEKPA